MVLIINNYQIDQNAHLGRLEMIEMGELCKKLSGMDYRVVHFSEVDGDYLAKHPEIKAVISGGCNNDWSSLYFDVFDCEFDLIRSCNLPFLGICAGLHMLTIAYDGGVRRMDFGKEERFFCKIDKAGESELSVGLSDTEEFFQYHYCCVPELPENFERIFTNKKCPIQGMRLCGTNKFGVQFHPELDDENHSAGHKLLQNFLALAK